MFNRRNGERRGPAHFLLGVLAGAIGVGTYTISCDATRPATSGTTGTAGAAGPPAARDVLFANTESDPGATTVHPALDEIGTTMLAATAGGAVTGGTPTTTTWAMEVIQLDVNAEELKTTGTGTLQLTQTAPGRGSYETSGANVFILDGLPGPPRGTKTGKYFVIGDLLMMTGEREPGVKTAYVWAAHLADGGRTITLNNFGSVTVVLTKQ
jgi:hypothetical protein